MEAGLRSAVLGAVCCLVAACSTAGLGKSRPVESSVTVEGVIIRNELVYTVNDVLIQVPATGGFAGCGNILPRSDCRTSFQAVDYRQNAIQVTWAEHGDPKRTDEFIVELPPDIQPGDAIWLEVVIYSPGLAGARFVQP
jgi:hypothetical protein